MSVTAAWSLEPPVSEEAFLRRELGLEWRQAAPAEIRAAAQRGPVALIVSEPEPYAPLLASLPERCAVLVMISDEGYAPARADLVRASRSVRSVYRQYPAHPASSAQIASAIAGFIRDARGTSQSPRTALPNWRKGRGIRQRMAPWAQVRQPVHDVPLGYTHAFVDGITAITAGAPDPDASLFDTALPDAERGISITFRGNRGLAQRIIGTERAGRLPRSDIRLVDADWSGFAVGDVGRAYVDALRAARFALCPPGFVNNESFRFTEALICGALPVEVEVALTHQGRLPDREGGSIRATSWSAALAQAEAMPEAERVERVTRARRLLSDRLRTLRAEIARDLEAR